MCVGTHYKIQIFTQKPLTRVENISYVNISQGEDSQCFDGSEVIEYVREVATESVCIHIPNEKHKPYVKIQFPSTTIASIHIDTV